MSTVASTVPIATAPIQVLPARRRQLDVALIVSTYQRPDHLRRALSSIALQKNVEGRFEVIVTDDGSQDETADVVADFDRRVDFPVQFTTHRHEQFQLARCRNEGVRATTARYLLFLDGDLVLPPDFVAQHLARRRAGVAMAGDSCYFTREDSQRVDQRTIESGAFLDWIPPSEEARLMKKALRARMYNFVRHPTRPRLKGGNIGIWRSDYERVNGYDENFVGWGLEETDLQWRLARHAVRFRASTAWTCTCHLWHPPSASFVHKARGTHNECYLREPGRLSVCRRGLRTRSFDELRINVVGRAEDRALADSLVDGRFFARQPEPEVEIVFSPGKGRFTRRAECRVLVVTRATPAAERLARRAHIVVADEPLPRQPAARRFPLREFDAALDSIC